MTADIIFASKLEWDNDSLLVMATTAEELIALITIKNYLLSFGIVELAKLVNDEVTAE